MAALKAQVDAKDAELKLAQAEARQAAQEAVGLTKDLTECQGFAQTSLQAVEEADRRRQGRSGTRASTPRSSLVGGSRLLFLGCCVCWCVCVGACGEWPLTYQSPHKGNIVL